MGKFMASILSTDATQLEEYRKVKNESFDRKKATFNAKIDKIIAKNKVSL